MTVRVIGINEETGLCPHCNREPILMELIMNAELSHTGEEQLKKVPIDQCIADIVKALNDGGIKTKACCCGHGEVPGNIILADGRWLDIKKNCEDFPPPPPPPPANFLMREGSSIERPVPHALEI